MTPEVAILLVQFAIKYGPDAAIAIASIFKTGATIDDAIAALNAAKQKTVEQYIAEAERAKAQAPAMALPVLQPA